MFKSENTDRADEGKGLQENNKKDCTTLTNDGSGTSKRQASDEKKRT